MSQRPEIAELERSIEPPREKILNHAMYDGMHRMEALRALMEHHVFAVWDFMSLLKSLQAACSCVRTPWVPVGNTTVRRLINDIVLGEESDEAADGSFASHYELYLAAMKQAGADTAVIERFVASIAAGTPVEEALGAAGAPAGAAAFVRSTFAIIDSGKSHAVAAAFTFGREELIPDMFRQIVKDLHRRFPGKLDQFVYYLDRHIELDGDAHGPMALKLVAELCGDDEVRWAEARQAAVASLEARRALWDSVAAAITERRSESVA